MIDVIEKAGGLKEDANIEKLNLAYLLEDGMKIYIPTNQELQEEKDKEDSEIDTGVNNSEGDKTQGFIVTGSDKRNSESAEGEKKSSKVNINTATQTDLETLNRNRSIVGFKDNCV